MAANEKRTARRITKADIRKRALRVAREYARASQRIEAAARSPNPLSAAYAVGLGPAIPALRWLLMLEDSRRRRAGKPGYPSSGLQARARRRS